MPLNPTIRSLAQDGRFTLRDAETLRSAVSSGQVSRAEAQQVLSRYSEAIEPEAASLLSDTFQTAARQRLTSFPEGFTGQTLQNGQRGEQVALLQRGLMAAGLAGRNPGMALASGADGIYGRETVASVQAFQRASGLPATGVADPATLRALQQAMAGSTPTASRPTTTTTPTTASGGAVRPSTGLRRPEDASGAGTARPPAGTTTTTQPAPTTTQPTTAVTLPAGVRPGTTSAVAAAARDLATGARAADYGTVNPWVNIDPRHAAPVDRSMGGLRDRWKCNLFAGNALAAAGFEPPYYGNRARGGEYPVAESWQGWSTPSPEFRARMAAEGRAVTDYAARTRNQSRFDLQDEVRPGQIADPAQRQRRVQEFLDRVQPGDVVTVDHPGASGSDGGHVRVCVGRNEQGQPLFAQARQNSAEIEAEGVSDFINSEAMFILRPNTPRQALPAAAPR
jgi:peptidoglycan hydrolase-like protein with peptidoglycan-binding domain